MAPCRVPGTHKNREPDAQGSAPRLPFLLRSAAKDAWSKLQLSTSYVHGTLTKAWGELVSVIKPILYIFPLQAEAAVSGRPRQSCQICQSCSGWAGHLHPARGTAPQSPLHHSPSSSREHQQLPRAPGQHYTDVEFVNMFFKASFGNPWADILLLPRY